MLVGYYHTVTYCSVHLYCVILRRYQVSRDNAVPSIPDGSTIEAFSNSSVPQLTSTHTASSLHPSLTSTADSQDEARRLYPYRLMQRKQSSSRAAASTPTRPYPLESENPLVAASRLKKIWSHRRLHHVLLDKLQTDWNVLTAFNRSEFDVPGEFDIPGEFDVSGEFDISGESEGGHGGRSRLAYDIALHGTAGLFYDSDDAEVRSCILYIWTV